ncbi:MAG: DUF3105 domain-containing protein [Anaerolineales bacterium]|nr:DUF3105 domain-containing protein [Anaerolineales bacterium]
MSSAPRQTPARARAAQQQAEWLAREHRRRRLIIGGWAAAALVFVGVLGYLIWQEGQPAPQPGEVFPIMAAGHISVGQPHDPYNSDPPTSGQHYETAVQAGFYDVAPVDEYLVHNLEHGHIIIWYNCTGLSDDACLALKDQIRDVMGRAGVSAITGTLKLVAVPRPTLSTPLALTSWGHLERLDAFDANKILAFIRAYRDQAPEPGAA